MPENPPDIDIACYNSANLYTAYIIGIFSTLHKTHQAWCRMTGFNARKRLSRAILRAVVFETRRVR